MIFVRKLESEDTASFRDLRLEALRLHPEAFGSLHAVEAVEPDAKFTDRLAKGGVFGGFIDGELLGMAGFYIHEAAQTRHKGCLWGMYVREFARGSGLAEAIVNAVIAHAASRIEQLLLSVAAQNHRAIRFYERLGFKSYAIEPRALKVSRNYVDELLMLRFITE